MSDEVIIIAHNMQHIFSVSDRIQVLRRGKYVTVQDVDKVSINAIVKYITGLDEEGFPSKTKLNR